MFLDEPPKRLCRRWPLVLDQLHVGDHALDVVLDVAILHLLHVPVNALGGDKPALVGPHPLGKKCLRQVAALVADAGVFRPISVDRASQFFQEKTRATLKKEVAMRLTA